MAVFNPSDPKQVAAARKREKADRDARHSVILSIMVTPAGRHYIHDRLVACHIFHSSFNSDALVMAFSEGERNVGLQLLGDIMVAAPDQYIQMMREASDREQENGRYTSTSDRQQRDRADNGRPDSGRPDDADGSGTVESEYEPADRED